ncbi:MAG: AbrB/MazE/SpoVT family DNA-binding domain-containing protein [Euryarchaeota archaeon]|nr:AbrB/MazE/SpoVT family DNA-binding domain-containing protein [Euryarchaeota archaeon]
MVESRALQFTGGATYALSLPKDWVTGSGLGKGDRIVISRQPDGSLVLRADSQTRTARTPKVIESAGEPGAHLLRRLIGAYVAGHGTIEVRFKGKMDPGLKRVTRDFAKTAIGPEIVEETTNKVVLQDLSDPTELSPEKCLRRMSLIVRSMHEDAIKALLESDEELAEDVTRRDSEIDRLCWLMMKQYNMMAADPRLAEKLGVTPEKALAFLLAARMVERIGDHAERISLTIKTLPRDKAPIDIRNRILSESATALAIFDRSLAALFSEDLAGANGAIDMRDKLSKAHDSLMHSIQAMRGTRAVTFATVVESIARTGFYATDISEFAINLIEGRTTPGIVAEG